MARWEFNLVCTSVYMYEERGGSDYVVVTVMLLLLLIYFRNIVLRYGYAMY